MEQNTTIQEKIAYLTEAIESNKVLTGTVLRCDSDLNLIVKFAGNLTGIIPNGESEIPRGETIRPSAIQSKVGRRIEFKVQHFEIAEEAGKEDKVYLSRRAVQEDYKKYIMENYKEGDILDGTVVNCEDIGAFVDIGHGVVVYLPTDNISLCRLKSAKDFFKNGDKIKVAIRRMWSPDGSVKMVLSHKELLGTWEENVARFNKGEVVIGVVRSINEHGAFVEIAPNLSGIAKKRDGIEVGDSVSAYIVDIIPELMKIKLSIQEKAETEYKHDEIVYDEEIKHIDKWVYSTPNYHKEISTDFNIPLPTKRIRETNA